MELVDALHSRRPVTGLTHGFYHYPARFSPEIARSVIDAFSDPGDWVLDPFMGGGTSIIEGLVAGRRTFGVDLNALAHFVADVRTTPLSLADEALITEWADFCSQALCEDISWVERPGIRNLPGAIESFIAGALEIAQELYFPRQRAFARCALLRLGQWALDCRDFAAPRRRRLAKQLPVLVGSMLEGLRDFVTRCNEAGVAKNKITDRRILLNLNAVDLHRQEIACTVEPKPALVLTSPPYPGVHVLYHRWQYFGRKETPAPYWIANVPDGCGASFYTCGSRTPTGLRKYFGTITEAFRSIREIIAPDAVVVQLVAFSDTSEQLRDYLAAMRAAGFVETQLSECEGARLGRKVPNRKWYAKLRGDIDAASEVLLIHRPADRP